MAKRVRGTTRPVHRRPQRQPTDPSTTIPARPSVSLTEEEAARAAELEARIVAEERAAEEARRRNRDRTRAEVPRARDATPLAVRAASEYAYVRRDVNRILALIGVQLLILTVLFVLVNVTGTIRI